MKLKVCGLNNPQNVEDIISLGPDYIGFIFYPGSKRYVSNYISPEFLSKIPSRIKKVGVFVDEEINEVERIFRTYKLDYVQLHGNESPKYCIRLFLINVPVIKVFSFDDTFEFKKLDTYASFCSYFLFDSKGIKPGGNGKKFNWSLIEDYDLNVPFFLSGGIGPNDADIIKDLPNEMLYAVDINSLFESEPGIKNVQNIEKFIRSIKPINQKVI